jgi:hypothetical protein
MNAVAEWVKRSTAAQGLNEKVVDQATIMQLVALVRSVLKDRSGEQTDRVA